MFYLQNHHNFTLIIHHQILLFGRNEMRRCHYEIGHINNEEHYYQ